MQSKKWSAYETTFRLAGMTIILGPIINVTWLPWVLDVTTPGYIDALLLNIPFAIVAWVWGYWVRRGCNRVEDMHHEGMD